MTNTPASSYDELPYESQIVAPSHPDRLAVMARLFGLNPPPVEHCRLLELGCAMGANLIAMAQSVPGGTFVGVDLSARQVAQGQAVAAELRFDNVKLLAMNLTDVDDAFGQFDYIVCHGVYSWVPVPVQAKILSICKRNLAPNGIAFVSYNVYPGWHQRGLVRGLLRYHTRGITDPTLRVREARAYLDFLARTTTPQGTPYALSLLQEIDLLQKCSDTYVFHEHLEDDNHPVYFHEFVTRAELAGLRYIAPARFHIMEAGFSPEIRQSLEQFGTDRVSCEQHIDFMLNRAFRQSLLCHQACEPTAEPAPDVLKSLRFMALARPVSATPDVRSNAPERFRSFLGDNLSLNQPLAKAAAVALHDRWPCSVGFEELWDDVVERLGPLAAEVTSPHGRDAFALLLLAGHRMNLAELTTYEPPITPEPGERPRIGALARRQAARGERVIDLRNWVAELQDFDRLLLPRLDGTHDRASLREQFTRDVAEGRLKLRNDDQTALDPAEISEVLTRLIDESLRRIVGAALVLAD